MTLILRFDDNSIYQKRVIAEKVVYPVSDFKKRSKQDKLKILNNFCKPYTNDKDFMLLLPNQFTQFSLNLTSLTYYGFKNGTNYSGKILFYTSDELKDFCPRIWTGSIEIDFSFLFP
jgi:hypothetical protein